MTGQFSWLPLFLSLAVMFWVAGFDIIYSLQDLEFDKANGLHSLPVHLGIEKALKVSSYSHLATILFLAAFGFVYHLGMLYAIGWILAGIFLVIEHILLSKDDLSRLQTAFFRMNGWVGIFLLIFTIFEIL